MKKKEMTAQEIRLVLDEIKPDITGQKLDSIWIDEKNRVLLLTFGMRMIVAASGMFYMTEKSDGEKTAFSEQLKKQLKGKKLLSIKQYDSERIVELEFGQLRLILELFQNGNFILVGSDEKIITALECRDWKDRSIRKNHAYEYPPVASSLAKKQETIEKKDVSFNKAFEQMFAEKIVTREERIAEQQKKSMEEFDKTSEEAKKKAELIQQNYNTVQEILSALQETRKKHGWPETKELLMKRYPIKSINERVRKLILSLSNTDIEIDFTKNLWVILSELYNKSKKMKQKKARAEKAVVQKETKKPVAAVKKQKKWQDDYLSFMTSDGFLVVSGKDDDSNERLIKKHTKPGDIVMHADIHGAAFTVIKNEGKQPGDEAIKEAAEFTAAHSKAWKLGLGAVDIYWVHPEQAVKVPGLPKGSFQIQGERHYMRRTPVRLAVGLRDSDLAIIPATTAVKTCKKFATLLPGESELKKLAAELSAKLDITIDAQNLQGKIPTGKARVAK